MRSRLDSKRGLPGIRLTQSQASAGPEAIAASKPEKAILRAAKGAIFLANADRQHGSVDQAEEDREIPEAEHERKNGDLGDDDPVIRVIHKTVRSAADQRRAGKDDDPRRPSRTQGSDDPDA